jgi:hypothetical protein
MRNSQDASRVSPDVDCSDRQHVIAILVSFFIHYECVYEPVKPRLGALLDHLATIKAVDKDIPTAGLRWQIAHIENASGGNAAAHEGPEHGLGRAGISLEGGKYADLAVLSDDYRRYPSRRSGTYIRCTRWSAEGGVWRGAARGVGGEVAP